MMRTIYLGSDFRCYTEAADGLRAVETMAFDDKCKEFIEGYRYVPDGESWQREDGEVFEGEMVAPATDFIELDQSQRGYEREQLEDALNALNILGVKVDG